MPPSVYSLQPLAHAVGLAEGLDRLRGGLLGRETRTHRFLDQRFQVAPELLTQMTAQLLGPLDASRHLRQVPLNLVHGNSPERN